MDHVCILDRIHLSASASRVLQYVGLIGMWMCWAVFGGSEVGRDQCKGPGICVAWCCRCCVCPVRFACVFFFLYGSGGLLSIRSTGLCVLYCIVYGSFVPPCYILDPLKVIKHDVTILHPGFSSLDFRSLSLAPCCRNFCKYRTDVLVWFWSSHLGCDET